ncbi:AAA family ATPase [Nonomuraea sp. NPDC050383]|uniref:AAA family ATPase n=1 Tax=Nonomuraea sp. NPDC050383 TaxID=3364362 RepID=UPI003795CA6C
MDDPSPTRAAPVLYGRRPEIEDLDRLLEHARAGRGGAVLLHGVAGVGKSALLEHLRARAESFRVLRAAGTESESRLRFAAVHQLFAPLLSDLGRMPPYLRTTVEAAFAVGDGDGDGDGEPAWFTMGLALRSLAQQSAADRPLLCLVDDAHWLDRPSARALDLMVRGLSSAGVAVALALRDPAARPEIEELPRLRLGPLAEDAAGALFDARTLIPVDGRVRRRILAEARGIPRALLQAPSPAVTAGAFLPVAHPASGKDCDLPAVVAALSAAGRMLLLVAAADPTGDRAMLWRAAAGLGLNAADGRRVQETGLVELSDPVRFADPALRAAVYRGAGAPARRRAHLALAEATDARAHADRRAWHRALAALGPDEHVATELEASAGQAGRNGGAAATAAFLGLSASLTAAPRRRAGRALAAAEAKREIGADDAALTLVSLLDADPAQRIRAATVRARIRYAADRDEAALDALLSAIAADPPQARACLLEALAVTIAAGHDASADQRRIMAEAVAALPEPPQPADGLLTAIAALLVAGPGQTMPLLRRALDSGPAPRGPLPAIAAMAVWDFPRWQQIAGARVRAAVGSGALAELRWALDDLAVARLHAGDLAAAEQRVRDGQVIAAGISTGVGASLVTPGALMCAAWRGDEPALTDLRRRALAEDVPAKDGRRAVFAELAQAVLLNGRGHYDTACQVLLAAIEQTEPGMWPLAAMEFVEAAARSGRPDLAAAAARRVDEQAAAAGTGWAAGLASWCQALLSDGSTAERFHREAVRLMSAEEPQPSAFLARAHLSYGEWLRRQGRRTDAGEQLRTAHALFAEMGAAGFAGRAERELAAGGAAPPGHGPVLLTPQEESIARLAAAGTTSKEIGQRLFLSPRTVDAHLRSVFAKLDITSRRQLREVEFGTPHQQ